MKKMKHEMPHPMLHGQHSKGSMEAMKEVMGHHEKKKASKKHKKHVARKSHSKGK